MSADDLTFASAYIKDGKVQHVHYARCEPCMFGAHPGGHHGWAGPEDLAHAAATGQPNPSGQRCACNCYDEPAADDEPPWDEPDSLTDAPCPVCGEASACAYDAEGLPLIHAATDPDPP